MYELSEISNGKWEIKKGAKVGMNVPVRVYGTKELVERMKRDRTFDQATNVACLPGIVDHSFVMPDGHEGYGFPIGGVAAFNFENGIVSPGGVGYDINCGLRLILTNLSEADVKPKMNELIDKLFKNVPSGVGSKGKIKLSIRELDEAVKGGAQWAIEKGYGWKEDAQRQEENGCIKEADPSKVTEKAKSRGAPQFGTLGAGNHFLEVQKVEKVMDAHTAKSFGLEEGKIAVMLHCGSRGFGHQVCDDYIRVMLNASRKYGIKLPDPELCCAPLNSQEANDYFGAMYAAVNYAFCNRQVMMHWIRETFEDVFKRSADALGMKLVYDVCHNIAKVEEHDVDGKKTKLCVHRKGATRAFPAGRNEIPSLYREVGQPVIIPGSMGTASYVLVGKESGKECFYSTCHGAGRTMSRHEAIRTYRGSDVKQSLESRGIYLRATGWDVISEEAPGAYKDIDEVVKGVELAGISRIVAKLVPLGVAKG
jgi:tRNA-splicing ligase RtcB